MTEQGPWVKARKLEDGWDIAQAMNILDFITSVQAGEEDLEEDIGVVRALVEDSARDSGMATGITITVGTLMFRRRQ